MGLKPTRARVTLGPRTFEGNAGLPVAHALTRSVRDCAVLLDCTAGPVLGDAYVAPRIERPFGASVGEPPGRLKIGFHTKPHHHVAIDPECIRAVEEAAKLCEELGHMVEPYQPNIDGMLFQEINLVLWSADNLLSLSPAVDVQRDLSDHPDLEWITSQIAERAKRFSALDLAQARQKMHQLSKAVAMPFAVYDLILSPVVRERPWKLGVYESGFRTAEEYFSRVYDYSPFCWPYNLSGQPAISVPFHWTAEDLPIGVMFASRYGDEATLIRVASQIELARPWAGRKPRVVEPRSTDM
ncbi:amidase family protein [Rhizobium sp. NXC14]|uniref:amidase n=1 Tax=Rhizobium sp. NXC14 TaxID=1981173 RepID=UPI0018DD02C3|nr:amidase family protein [Rhizobium sp. NXC14]